MTREEHFVATAARIGRQLARIEKQKATLRGKRIKSKRRGRKPAYRVVRIDARGHDYGEVYKGVQAAADALDVWPSSITNSCLYGTRLRNGMRFRYLEKPPISYKTTAERRQPIVRESDGQILSAASDAIPTHLRFDKSTYKRELKRLFRAIHQGKPYLGEIYIKIPKLAI